MQPKMLPVFARVLSDLLSVSTIFFLKRINRWFLVSYTAHSLMCVITSLVLEKEELQMFLPGGGTLQAKRPGSTKCEKENTEDANYCYVMCADCGRLEHYIESYDSKQWLTLKEFDVIYRYKYPTGKGGH